MSREGNLVSVSRWYGIFLFSMQTFNCIPSYEPRCRAAMNNKTRASLGNMGFFFFNTNPQLCGNTVVTPYMWYLPISAGAPDLEPFLTVSRSEDETSRREVFLMSFFSDRISVRTFYRLRQYLPGEITVYSSKVSDIYRSNWGPLMRVR